MPNPPTLKDIARHAGVSEATASRALHRRPGTIAVSADARDRVRRAARELGYRANRLARSLSRSRTDTIGVLLPFDAATLSRSYNSMILAGVGQTASRPPSTITAPPTHSQVTPGFRKNRKVARPPSCSTPTTDA